jgi:hypothetical protein
MPPTPHRRFAICFVVAALATLLLFPAHGASQDRARRLILKDGSYQSVTKYEVKGDRVRYLSAERDEWEELPASLVDWSATEKYEKDRAAGASVPEAVELDKELKAESDLNQARLPQVAPGLRLPEDSGVFLLDNFHGEPQLNEIQQTEGDLNRNTKGNIFRATINPAASSKVTFELDGEHAKVQSHANVPSLYIKPDDSLESSDQSAQQKQSTSEPVPRAPQSRQQPQQPQQPEQPIVPFDRFRIVRAQTKNGNRILGDVKRAVTGKTTQEQQFVKTTIDRISGGWLKVTPTESLTPGEYALVEMMGKEGMNLYVWDFGVNPTAPANANPWKPEPNPAPKPEGNPADAPK